MAQRKHLTISSVLYLLIYFPTCIYANPWLVAPQKYQYSITFLTLDNASRKHRQQTIQLYNNFTHKIAALYSEKEKITKSVKYKLIEMSSYHQEKMKYIDNEIDALKYKQYALYPFYEDHIFFCTVQYGINDISNIGLSTNYKIENFAPLEINNQLAHDIILFYKYNIFNRNQLLVTINPSLCYEIAPDEDTPIKYFDIAILLGYSNTIKDSNVFYNVGIQMRHYTFNSSYSYIINASEGVKLDNGFSVNSYSSYEKNSIHQITYSQLSIAKRFNFGNINKKEFNCQLGYFWKKNNRHGKQYKNSGINISLWLTI